MPAGTFDQWNFNGFDLYIIGCLTAAKNNKSINKKVALNSAIFKMVMQLKDSNSFDQKDWR